MQEKMLPAEAELARICQAERMQVVGQLTGGVVHDFNNILTVITGTIEILDEAVADRPEFAAVVELIAEAAARGASLTSHLLAFARRQPARPRDVDLNPLLGEAGRLLRPTLGEQIEVDCIAGEGFAAALVDPSRFMTAILNLAIMARDAMPEGGKLTFALRSPMPGERCGGASADMSAADHVVVVVDVVDYGIATDWREPGFVGLGAIRDAIGQCDGHIKLRQSTSGRGISAEIYLPAAASPVASSAPDRAKAQLEGGGEAVLVVEDDVLVRRYVVSQVKSLGYRTLAVGNAGEALAIIDGGEAIDLLFTDVVMPGGINGRQLATEAQLRRPSLRTLFTSGYAENAMVGGGYLEAGVLLLAKPYRKADLAKMIRTALSA
jgi:CheY-like chemotaxis protein